MHQIGIKYAYQIPHNKTRNLVTCYSYYLLLAVTYYSLQLTNYRSSLTAVTLHVTRTCYSYMSCHVYSVHVQAKRLQLTANSQQAMHLSYSYRLQDAIK